MMRRIALGAVVAMAMAMAPAAGVLAQDDMMEVMVPHPSHIHTGRLPGPG